MSTGDLNINTIDRFRKRSDRLVLEQHGSCEVPAGCGGVVLRWHNPDSGQPVVFACAASANVELYVNGQVIASRAVLPWGESNVALRLTEISSKYPFVMSTQRDVPPEQREDIDQDLTVPDGCTALDGSWRCSTEEHDPETVTQLGFDDSQWTVLKEVNENFPEANRWLFESVQRRRGQPLRLPKKCQSLWIRTTLAVSRGDS